MKKSLLLSLFLLKCAEMMAQATFCTSFWGNGTPVTAADINITLSAPGEMPATIAATGVSCFSLEDSLLDNYPAGTMLQYSGVKNGDDLNGVNILDMAGISSHILGLYPLTSPYAYFAADVNQSGTITGFDIVHIRNLIIGNYETFPNSTSWRLNQGNCIYPNPFNPFSNTCPAVSVDELLLTPADTLPLAAVKIGDVNGDASPTESFSYPLISDFSQLLMPDILLPAGIDTVIEIKMGGNLDLHGMQVEFLYDTSLLTFNGPVSTDLFPSITYHAVPGKIKVANLQGYPALVPGILLMKLRFTPHSEVYLPNAFSLNPSVLKSLGVYDLVPPRGIQLGSTLYHVSAASEPGAAFGLSEPSPNPFAAATTFSFQLETPETVLLEVFDLQGKRLYRYENRLPAGEQTITLGPDVIPSGSVGYYRIQAGKRWSSGTLVRW